MTTDQAEIQLTVPRKQHEQAVLEYKNEFLKHEESMHGCGGIERFASYDEWLEKLDADAHGATVSEGRVQATQFLAFRQADNRLVGMIQVRHDLNDFLLHEGGHIGYSVRASERRQGYASKMLQQALAYCQELHLNKILITCDKDNVGSAAVIKKAGGILENEVLDKDNQITQRYWVTLS